MKNLLFSALLTSGTLAFAALPEVTNVALEQSGSCVKVSYELDAPAIVTLDILTNGVSIGGIHLSQMTGDVNQYVTNTIGRRSITIYPQGSFDVNLQKRQIGAKAVVTAWPTNCPPDYMVADLTIAKSVRFYPNAEQVPGGVGAQTYKTDKLMLRKIPAAGVVWRMGSPSTEKAINAWNTEAAHYVTLTADYYIGVYELTHGQFTVTGADKDKPDGTKPKHPFTGVSWANLRGWGAVWPDKLYTGVEPTYIIGKLRAITGVRLDLPTDAQWEFACRAGCGTAYYSGLGNVGDLAWYGENANGATHEVGLKEPNAWGLYDMLGNANELCLDLYGDQYGYTKDKDGNSYPYVTGVAEDPIGRNMPGIAIGSASHVIRGGDYSSVANAVRCACRADQSNVASEKTGFRVSCPAVYTP